MDEEKRCSWCNTLPSEAAARYEGPHATWCPYYQRPTRPVTDLRDLLDAEKTAAPRKKDGG